MNACLRDLAKLVVDAFRSALDDCGVKARFFLTQNDGTLMDAAYRRALPGADLRQRPDQLDARRGVPLRRRRRDRRRYRRHHLRCRRAAQGLSAARRRSRSRSAACAPTSACPTSSRSASAAARWWSTARTGVTVGPRSVGYKLDHRGAGLRRLDADDDRHRRRRGPRRSRRHAEGRAASTPDLIARTEARIADMLETAVERSRLSPEPLPVIVVGGGSILVKGKIGGLEVVKPQPFRRRQRGRRRDRAGLGRGRPRLFARRDQPRADAIDDAEEKATGDRRRRRRARGLDRGRRRRGRAARLSARQRDARACQSRGRPACRVTAIRSTRADLLPLALGAALLGTGGGGNPYIGMLRAARTAAQGRERSTCCRSKRSPTTTWIGSVGGIGAPVVGIEKIKQGDECLRALRGVEEAAGRQVSRDHLGRDRRLQLDRADADRRHAGPAGGRRRRHGPRVSRSADVDLLHLRRSIPRPARSPTTRAMSSSSRQVSTCIGSSASPAMSRSTWARARASRRRRCAAPSSSRSPCPAR